MRNRKLVSFEVIEKAVAGEPDAIDTVLRHFTGHIKYLSNYQRLYSRPIESTAYESYLTVSDCPIMSSKAKNSHQG